MASQAALDLIIGLKDNASGPLGKITGALGGLAKIGGAAFLGGAVAGVAGLSAALVGGLQDARAANIIMAQTEAVIKSTGGAAGVTAGHIAELSGALSAASGKSLFGDDQIQESANLLLTFTNLKGGVLDAATAMSVDLAQAMGGAPADAAVQLGKALNDPIGGISALTRVGVTFTDQQKAQIKTMVEAGDVAGAQGIILAELNKEFGGSAAAAAAADGGMAQFKDRMGELAESVGAQVLPALNSLMGWLNSPEIQAGITALVDGLVTGIGAAFTWISGTAIPMLIAGWQVLHPAIAVVSEVFAQVVSVIQTTVLPAFASLVAWFQGDGTAALTSYAGFFTGIWDQVLGIVNAVLPSIQSIIQTVFGVISTFLQEHGAQILSTLQGAWETVSTLVSVAVATVGTIVQTVFGVIASFLAENSDSIQAVLSTAWETIQTIIEGATLVITNIIIPAFTAIAGFISDHSAEIQAILQTAWDLISTIVTTVLNVIQGLVRTVMAVIQGDWSGAWTEIKATAETLWNGIKSVIDIAITAVKAVIDRVLPTIQSALDTAWEAIKSAATTAWEALRSGVETKIAAVVTLAQGIAGKVTAAVGSLGSVLLGAGKALIQGLLDGINAAWGAVQRRLSELTALIPDWKGPADKDAKLLFESGRLIIGGLNDGMESQFPNVKATLGDLTTSIGSAAAAIEKLLITGDFRGGILGLEEDDPFIDFLFRVREDAGSAAAALELLKTGDFRGGILGLMEDDPFIDMLFDAREAGLGMADTLVGGFVDQKPMEQISNKIKTMLGKTIPADAVPFAGTLGGNLGASIVGGFDETKPMDQIANKIKTMLGQTIPADAVPFAGTLGGNLGQRMADEMTRKLKTTLNQRIPNDAQPFIGVLGGNLGQHTASMITTGLAQGVAAGQGQLTNAMGQTMDVAFATAQGVAQTEGDRLVGIYAGVVDRWNALTDAIKMPDFKTGPGTKGGGPGKTGPGEKGQRALGGPVTAGSSYLVGERGPEFFMPRQSGTIIPNNKIGGDTYTTNITFEPGSIVQQPGEDARMLAARVADELDRRNRLARTR